MAQENQETTTESGDFQSSNDSGLNASFISVADETLAEFFVSELKDMYWSEKHLIAALPKMAAAATSPEVQQAFSQHLEITRKHAMRLEQVFNILGEDALPKKCPALEGLALSGEAAIENTHIGTPVRDTAIVMSGLKVENFEITAYTGLINVANALGQSEAADLLQENLDEEKEAAAILTALSEDGLSNEEQMN